MQQTTKDRLKAIWEAAEKNVAAQIAPIIPVAESLTFLDVDGYEIEIGELYYIEEINQVVKYDGNYLIGEFGEHFTEYLVPLSKLRKKVEESTCNS